MKFYIDVKIEDLYRAYFEVPTKMDGGMIVITFVFYLWKPC